MSGMDVTFTVLAGRTFVLYVEAWDSLDTVKARIAEQEAIPLEGMRLIFAGKELTNGRTLADYNVQRDSTIHVIPARPRPG